MTTAMAPVPGLDLIGDLLLLSGLRSAPTSSSWPVGQVGARTCLDGGSETVVSISAPGDRRLGIYTRQPHPDPSASHWTWSRRGPGGETRDGWRVLFSGEQPGTWAEVLATAALSTDDLGELRRWHGILGPNGRIYSMSASVDEPLWVSWQLDRRAPIRSVLDALEVDGTAGLQLITDLLGVSAGPPWSVALAVDVGRWRLGTSRWAREREDRDKRRRLVASVQGLGGDSRFTEAVYKLVNAVAPTNAPVRTGRAVEVELPTREAVPRPLDVEFFLSALTDRRPS